jgi:hypothetical protein
MKKSPRIYGQLELPRNGRLANVRTREELFRILGFCSSDGTPVALDVQKEAISEVSEVSETKSADPGLDNSDYIRNLSSFLTRRVGSKLAR